MKLDLKYDNFAIYKLEKECGRSLQGIGRSFQEGNYEISLIFDLLWAGLLHKEPALTIQDVCSRFDDVFQDPVKYGEAIGKAFEEAFPEAEEEHEEPVKN